VTLLTNPLFLKMALLLVSCAFAFVLALVLMRSLRRNLDEEASFRQAAAGAQMLAAIHRQLEQCSGLSAEAASKLRESLVPVFGSKQHACDPNSQQAFELSAGRSARTNNQDQAIGGFGKDNRRAEAASSHS